MPLVVVSVNAPVPDASKKALAKDLGHIISNDLKIPQQHVHIQVQDGQFISFAGDPDAPAVTVAVKCAYNSIDRDARTRLVNAFAPAFTHAVKGLTPDRVYLTFEELPVQHMAPGTSIMVFDTMHTAPSSGELATPPAPITPA